MLKKIEQYYDSDIIGELYGLPGGGITGLMVGDHLHPPMVHDEKIWENGNRWQVGAVESTRILAEMAKIKRGSYVLDVGSGLGGPARYLAEKYNCRVLGVNVSELQTSTARLLVRKTGLENSVRFVVGDIENMDLGGETFDVVWTMNMFYHLKNKRKALKKFFKVLRSEGTLAFDDWVITDRTTKEEHSKLTRIWQNPSFGTIGDYMSFMKEAGFVITQIKDVSDVGRYIMPKYFEKVFDRHFRPKIERIIPEHGADIAETFKADVRFTIELYQDDKFGYYKLIAEK